MTTGSSTPTSPVTQREVTALRRAARSRALSRAPVPFAGSVDDAIVGEAPVRRYRPARAAAGPENPHHVTVFLHGGFGVFGDLDLQDGWCRRLADGLGDEVVSVDYPLAPEHFLGESVSAVSEVAAALEPSRPVVLCGDSAGAALVLAASPQLARSCDALVLTNPNIDLSLGRFDRHAPDGPDRDLSARAFATWTHGWTQSTDFVTSAAALPPTFVAVGRRDAVLREARDLAAGLQLAGQRHELAEYDAGHGFLGDDAVTRDVIFRVRRFLGR